MIRTSFKGFVRSDFFAFKEGKHEDPKFNDERKMVWKKMKNLQSCLNMELKRKGLALEGSVSQYWINYTKRRVNGIWLAYTEIKPYYLGCQLNCGIYEGGVFAGIEINEKAKADLNRVADFINHNEDEFLYYVKKLDPHYVRIGYGNWWIGPSRISTSDLDELLEALGSETGWFDLGEWYPKSEDILVSADFVSRIADIFELLFPLYLVFVGRRPFGHRKTDKLLRIGDVRDQEITRREKELAPEVSKLTVEELDEVIASIDRCNKSESIYRYSRETKTYRRNPVLSSALKQKHKDKCQLCGITFKVDRGFFCDTHHLKPLKAGGLDTSDNILVLCPNHHRIFDRSHIEIISRDKSKIVIGAGKQIFDINL